MKVSMMGSGSPILKPQVGIVPVDRRLGKEETQRINRNEELAVIELQKQMLELEAQKQEDEKASVRDSYALYDYEDYVEQEYPNY
jgi:hypothetical protein